MKSKSRSSSVISKMSRENYERWPSHTRVWGLFTSGSSTWQTTTGQEPYILPETRPQNGSNCTSRSAFFTSFGPPNQPIFPQRSNRSLEICPFSCVTRRFTRSRVRSRRASSTALAYGFFPLAMAGPNLWLWTFCFDRSFLSKEVLPNPLCPLFNTHFQEREP